MAATLLEPPSTTEELRERAEGLAEEVAGQLAPIEEATGPAPIAADQDRTARLASRMVFFESLRAAVRAIASSRVWSQHELKSELLLLLERLRDELEADPDATDPGWRVREVLQRMLVVLQAMVRQLEHNELDRPELAAQFVARTLEDVEVGEVAQLLGTTNRMVTSYRNGDVSTIRKHPARITLVAQVVNELRGSMTPRGALLWFDARRPQLGGHTPRELIDEDPVTHRSTLIALARGGRAQTDQGGAAYAALDRAS
jgi:hypothetical protein